MKVAELQGAQLDYWVARAEGALSCSFGHFSSWYLGSDAFPYSTEWSNGGPIIDRERINIVDRAAYLADQIIPNETDDGRFAAFIGNPETIVESFCSMYEGLGFRDCQLGPTQLTAAMRAYVASKYGDQVPDEPAAATAPR